MVHKNYSSTVGLAVLLTAVTVADVQWVRAQTAAFQFPASVPQGTNVRIDGSSSMTAVNTVLKQRFEQQFAGTQVNIAANGASAGIQAVLGGQADLAAIGRPLTDAEKSQGLKAVQVGRDKIAILIGAGNPFTKSLTIDQFAKMFRGEVKNWSEVGGQNVAVKFVDRPDSSDTRQAFKGYPVFKQGKFATGATAEKLNEDTTQAVVASLGNNGVSYTTANQTKGLSGAKVVAMHGTQPTDPRYPFSQALYYVYKDQANPAVQAFLGFATAAPGQGAIEQAGVADAVSGSAKAATAQKTAEPADAKAAKEGAAPKPASGQVSPAANLQGGDNAQGGSSQSSNPLAFLFPGADPANSAAANSGSGFPNWLWWLLPIGSGAALLWMLGRGRQTGRDRGATGTFNAPGYAGEFSERGTPPGGTPYVEGGFDPLQGNGDFSANVNAPNPDLSLNAEPNRFGNLDLNPNLANDPGRAPSIGIPGNLGGAALAGGAAAAGAAAWSLGGNRAKQSRLVLKSRSSQEVEAFWDIPTEERQAMRQQGGEKLALRLYDVTEIDLAQQPAHSVQQFECDELTQRQRLPIALPDRDYLAEIGYLTSDNQWLSLARSTHVRVPAASNNFLGNAAKAGGAAVVGGAAVAGGAVDSAKSFLSGDRDAEAEPAIEVVETPAADSQSPGWFERVTHPAGDTTHPLAQSEQSPSGGDAGGISDTQTANPQSQSWFERITHPGSDPANDVTQTASSALRSGGDAVAGGAAGAGAAAWSFLSGQPKPEVSHPEAPTATGETAISGVPSDPSGETIEAQGRLVLTPRNARWAYASWDIPRSLRSRINPSAGEHLVLRLYDVTDGGTKLPARYEQHDIDEMALSCDVPIPLGDRTYVAEVGYVDANYQWTPLARSAPAHVPAT